MLVFLAYLFRAVSGNCMNVSGNCKRIDAKIQLYHQVFVAGSGVPGKHTIN